MKVVYLVHNIGDPAVRRRVEMMRSGGAEVNVIGFQRDDQAPLEIDGVEVTSIGRSFDARMIQRTSLLAASLLRVGAYSGIFKSADVLIARNLEMLALAVRARAMRVGRQPIVYECLDIHRLLLRDGLGRRLLRGLEKWLMRRCDLLMVSSPAFLRNYFEPLQRVRLPAIIVENKMLRLEAADASDIPAPQAEPSSQAPPYRIGWFGMIRCQKSLDFLCDFVREQPGLVEVVIRGRPSLTEFRDFEAQVAKTPGVSFHGPYRAADLPAHYDAVHFTWAIDYFEDGLNSNWLLPNRLYEGSAHGAVPIALAEVETGRWLERHECGIRLERLSDLHDAMLGMTSETYLALRAGVIGIPRNDLIATQADCGDLVGRLAGLKVRNAAGVVSRQGAK